MTPKTVGRGFIPRLPSCTALRTQFAEEITTWHRGRPTSEMGNPARGLIRSAEEGEAADKLRGVCRTSAQRGLSGRASRCAGHTNVGLNEAPEPRRLGYGEVSDRRGCLLGQRASGSAVRGVTCHWICAGTGGSGPFGAGKIQNKTGGWSVASRAIARPLFLEREQSSKSRPVEAIMKCLGKTHPGHRASEATGGGGAFVHTADNIEDRGRSVIARARTMAVSLAQW